MKEQTQEQKQKTSQTTNKPSTEKPKEVPKTTNDKQTLSGITEVQEKPAWWDTAAQTIAGDNKLLGGILRFVLSPLGLIIGAGILGFGIYKTKQLKDENEKLKTENKLLKQQLEDLEAEYSKTKKKCKKLKALNEDQAEHNMQGLMLSNEYDKKSETNTNKKYQTAYLN